MRRAKITGVGHYVPPRVVTNFDLEKLMDTGDQWVRERTAIVERRWVDEKTATSDPAAIQDANSSLRNIDFIIFASLSPDYFSPGAGVILGEKLNIRGVAALEVRNQCSGFIYGLSVADQYIKTVFIIEF